MSQAWDPEWTSIKAEYRDAQDAARVLTAPSTEEEARAHGRVMDRFREAAKKRICFIDKRRRADRTWQIPPEPPPVPV